MFRFILTSAGTLMHIYVFWRVASVPLVMHHVPQKLLIGAGVVFWVGFLFALFLGHGGRGLLATTLELFGMNWLGLLFLTFVCLFAIDLVTGFGLLLPRIAPSLRGWALIASGVLSVFALVQVRRQW